MARRYLLMAVAVPVAAATARKVSRVIEARRGPTRTTRLLARGADTLQGTFGRDRRRFL